MFNCAFCKKTVKPRIGCKKVAIAKYAWNHPHRYKVIKKWVIDKTGKLKLEWVDDVGGGGLQIACEVNACPECAQIKEKEECKIIQR